LDGFDDFFGDAFPEKNFLLAPETKTTVLIKWIAHDDWSKVLVLIVNRFLSLLLELYSIQGHDDIGST
jgi:hypothetical protein